MSDHESYLADKLVAVSRLPHLKVLVLGDVMLDVYDFCNDIRFFCT